MDRLRFARLKDVVVAAIDLPASQRSAYLDEACGDDGDLRARAASMLRLAGPETDLLRTGGMARILDRLGRSEGGGEALSPTSDGRATTPHLLSPGVVLAGRYRIERLLGRGGMGVVYEALDQLLSIRIALKTLRLTGPTNDEMSRAVRRLKSEVLLARTISHPHVCRMYDLGRSGDDADATWFLTMELVRGETLAERIRRQGRLRPDEALPLIEQISAALDAAHRAGIVHSDLKSGNVMLTRSGDAEHAMVMDFGLAQAVAPETDARHREPVDPDAGTTVAAVGAFGALPALAGTPAYMSPEQVLGRDASPASDVYALGIVVYEMVTGVLPFAGDTPLEIAFRRVTDSPPSPRTHVDDIDARWEATILHCLATDPAERFQRAVEVADALSRRRPVEAVPSNGPPDHHLPAEVDAFVGRSAELATLARRLEGEDRLVTLLGAAG
ncbi:MAG: serine/threonine-protein kinase, partial [Candidatus Eiseniibacteriota bacterium]